MKRDLELIVELLKQIEDLPPGDSGEDLEFYRTGREEEWLLRQYHLDLVIDAGFVACRSPDQAKMGEDLYLTWAGCEFLDAVRNDSWRKKLTKEVGSVAMEVVKTLGVAAGVKAGQEFLGL